MFLKIEYLIIIVILVLVLFTFTLNITKGWIGEKKVYLKSLFLLKKEGRIISDLMLPKKEDLNVCSQIDHLIISEKGIFVIEVKNYSGKIYGSDEQQNWTQSFNYGKKTYQFYSPVKQNLTHCNRVKEHLSKQIDVYSVVIFLACDIDSVKSENVYSFPSFKKFYKSKETKYSKEDVEELYNYFLYYKENKVKSSYEHVKTIKENRKTVENNICPYCNKKLILKNGKYGKFYACENYPKCRFTKNVDK